MINIKLLLEKLKGQEGWGKIIAALLESDINAVDKKGGNNALYLVILDSLGENIELITFLIANGININHQNSLGNTALLYSVASGYSSVIRILLENGADINIKNNENITPAILLQNEMRINQIELKPHYDKIVELLNIAKITDQIIVGGKPEEQNINLLDNNEWHKFFVNRLSALTNKNSCNKTYEICEQTKVEQLGKNNVPDDI